MKALFNKVTATLWGGYLWFDLAVIKYVCEPVARWAEHGFGVTNFMIARGLAVVWLAGVLSEITWQENLAARIIWAVISLVAVIFCPLLFFMAHQAEQMMRRHGLNPLKVTHVPTRGIQFTTFLLVGMSTLPVVTPNGVALLAVWLFYGFLACDRPPPQEVKIPTWAQPARLPT